jgi:hypothetical protein
MTVRKLGAATQRNYIRAVKTLSEFLGAGHSDAGGAPGVRQLRGVERASARVLPQAHE